MIIFQINISPLQSMIAKLLFIMLIAFYNASESLYKIYNETNYIDNNSGYSKSSMGALLNQILKFSIQSEIAKDPQKIVMIAGIAFLHDFFIGQNDNEFQEDWKKEMDEFTQTEIYKLKKLFDDFSKQCEDLDENIYGKEIDELNSIFEKEKKLIVNDYIIDFIQSNIIEKNLKNITRLNILCLGKSQIGKTTLINEILFLDEKHKGKTGGEGKSTTMNDTAYISEKLKHIKIIDSRGMESGNFSLKNFSERYKNKMSENTKYGSYSDLIHCIWYCVSGNIMNDEEIAAIRQINSLFNKFEVPIIFVYLKPFNYNDVMILRKVTSEINNNFIAVQSIHHIDECDKNDINCFKPKIEYTPRNMDVLLKMTNNLTLEGIKNAVSSRSSFYLQEKIEKTLEIRFNKKTEEYINLFNSIVQYIKNDKSHITLNNIDSARKANIEKIIEIIEETLFNSERKLSKEGRNIIYSIQKKIEDLYIEKFSSLYKEHLFNLFSTIQEKKKSLHNKYNEKTWFGCNDLDNKGLTNDWKKAENSFDSNYIVQIYSMLASFETINKKLKSSILSLLKSRIDEIISDEILIGKLEKKIQLEAEKWTMSLINSLNDEINNSFN